MNFHVQSPVGCGGVDCSTVKGSRSLFNQGDPAKVGISKFFIFSESSLVVKIKIIFIDMDIGQLLASVKIR